jgi:hypothetical protein
MLNLSSCEEFNFNLRTGGDNLSKKDSCLLNLNVNYSNLRGSGPVNNKGVSFSGGYGASTIPNQQLVEP